MMTDWRDKKIGKKDTPKKPTPMPVVPRKPNTETTSYTDWRKRQTTVSPVTPVSRPRSGKWSKDNAKQPAKDIGSLKRTLRLGIVGGAIAASIAVFYVYIVRGTPPIPVFASIDEVEANERPVTAVATFADHTRKRLAEPSSLMRTMTFADPKSDANELLNRIKADKEKWIEEVRKGAAPSLSKDFVGPQHLRGGGYNGNIIAFYFQGVITKKNAGQWQLLTRGDKAFDNDSQEEGVELSQLFRHLAEAIPPGALAIVGLDVSTPSVVTNLGDLHFPTNEIKQAWESNEGLKDRTVLLLPCQDGEENWIAPELSSTVFGHFFLEGLATGFGKNDLNVLSFTAHLRDAVRNWVNHNRRAIQTPEIIENLSDEQLKSFTFYRPFLTTMPAQKAPISSSIAFRDRFKSLDDDWESFAKLAGYASWDPIHYSQIESGLVSLENIAESSSVSHWTQLKERVDQELKKAAQLWISERKVSLIETAFLQRLGRHQTFLSPLLNESASPDTFQQLVASRSKEEWNDRNNRALAIWNLIEDAAASNDAPRWKRMFAKEPMEAALQFVGEPTANKVEWLEIQLCHILVDEVDWRNATDDCYEAMAKLISCFSTLQHVICTSDSDQPSLPAEKAAWIQQEVFEADQLFLTAFDAFCANQWQKSSSITGGLLQTGGQLDSLKKKSATIDQLIEARDVTLREVPHLLALLIRTARYASISKEQVDGLSERLAKLLDDAKKIEIQLATPSSGPLQSANGFGDLLRLRSEILRTSRTIGQDAPPLNAESIRDYRIALRYPSLPLNDRKKYHSYVAEFYSSGERKERLERTEGTSNLNEPMDTQIHSPRGIAQNFVRSLERTSTIDRDLFEKIATSDVRITQWPIQSNSSRTDSQNNERHTMYSLASRTKIYASSLKDKNGLSPQDLPWRSALDFAFICEQEYCDLQATRLYRARWGNGRYSNNYESLYFRQLAKNYQILPRDSGASFPSSSDVPKQWEQAKRDFESLPNRFIETQKPATNVLDVESVSAGEHDWGKTTAALRQWPRTSKPGFPPLVSSLALSEDAKTSIGFDYQSTDLAYRLSIRGHTIEKIVDRAGERAKISLTFTKPKELASIKLVASSEPQSVVILLDCSSSMSIGNVFKDAKESARRLLENFKKLSDQGVQSEVVIMLFGLQLNDDSQLPDGFKFATINRRPLISFERSDQRLSGSAVICNDSGFVNSNSDELNRLQSLLNQFNEKDLGETPLYNAMQAAGEMLSLRKNTRRNMIVISDGGNFVNTERALKKDVYECTIEQLQIALGKLNSRLSLTVFQFDNQGYSELPGMKGTETATKIKEENAKLFELVKSMSGTGKIFGNFETLQKSLADAFSLPKVFLNYEGNKEFIPLEFARTTEDLKPGWCQITVQDPASDSKSIASSKIKLTGNEQFEIHFSEQQRTLSLVPTEHLGFVPLRPKNASGNIDRDSLFALHERSSGILFKVDRRSGLPFTVPQSNQVYSFVPRPEFVVASVMSSSDNPLGPKFVIADVGYTPTYPPQMFMPTLPLDPTQDKRVQMDLWYADVVPEAYLESISMRDGESKVSKTGGAALKRTESQVSVQVKTNPDNRVFVICSKASSTIRDFFVATPTKGPEELHALFVEGSPETVQVLIIDEAGLRKAVEDRRVEHRWANYTLSK